MQTEEKQVRALLIRFLTAMILMAWGGWGGAQDLAITEFLARNGTNIVDEDGDHADWMEIRNLGEGAVHLEGWFLTDDFRNLTKWRFPAVEIEVGDCLVVFASGKDRAGEAGELHTNFQLDGDGEYLALIMPDGTTAAHEFAPAFPPQVEDVSYGIVQEESSTQLIGGQTQARIHVPADGDAGLDWLVSGFDDAQWEEGSVLIGFDAEDDSEPSGGGSVNLALGKSARQSSTGYGGFASRAVDGDTNGVFSGASITHTAPDDPRPWWQVDLEGTFVLERIVLWNRTDCCSERLSNFRVSVLDEGEEAVWAGDHFIDRDFPETQDYEIMLPGGTSGRFVLIEKLGPDREGDIILSLAEVEVFQEPTGFGHLIERDIEELMFQFSSSLYVRIPFQVSDPDAFDILKLRVQYDDGFIAYLNGREVARRNAPDMPAWNSAASAEHPDMDARQFEKINISQYVDELKSGGNVLALHGLNLAADDHDFLLIAELEGASIESGGMRYFLKPTPGSANDTESLMGFVADTEFSRHRGFYDEPFEVVITCATPGAEIRYTLDGSAPTETTAMVYADPIDVTTTTTLRAAAFREGFGPSNIDTQTYLFADDVIKQTGAGFPASWGGTAADYRLDPNVYNASAYRDTIADDLKSIPVLSIVMDQDDLFGPQGIYSNTSGRGEAWERPCSMEIIYPGSGTGSQVNCGIRIFGYGWRSHSATLKHAFRLLFKRAYGPARLQLPFFADWPIRRVNNIVLRSQGSRGWNDFRTSIEQTQYMRDAWARYTARDMGKLTTSSTYVSLYLNGLYWGLYNPVERPDAAFMEDHVGGEETEYDAMNARVGTIEVIDGRRQRWDELIGIVRSGVSTLEEYRDVKRYLDVDDFIDYMMINFYTVNRDWVGSNGNNMRVAGGFDAGVGFKCFCWDMEYSIWNATDNVMSVRTDYDTPAAVYAYLRSNTEFRSDFADHAHRHLFNSGALTPQAAADRWMKLAAVIDRAIVGESARWGDRRREPPYTRDVEWIREQNRLLTSFFPQRTGIFLGQLKQAGLYPAVEAPVFNRHGGAVESGFTLTMTAPAGDVLYTLDGSDPRLEGGGVSPAALVYESPISIFETVRVQARARHNGSWSALNEAVFSCLRPIDSLRVTEVMYHPRDDGDSDGDAYEFLELKNTGDEAVDLSGCYFSEGIVFTFPEGTVLDPGGFLVLAHDSSAFFERYPEVEGVFGDYSGNLANTGDLLVLNDSDGNIVFSIMYDDDPPWSVGADGDGPSLVALDPEGGGDQHLASYFRLSTFIDGSPGCDDGEISGEGGLQLPGDINQDGGLDISDAIGGLLYLFSDSVLELPCNDGELGEGALLLIDNNGDKLINIADVVYLLAYLFNGGAPPVLGTECVRIPGCPDVCVP